MSKEIEHAKLVNHEPHEYVPFKLPGLITPFNIGDVMSIQAMNEKKMKSQTKPLEKK